MSNGYKLGHLLKTDLKLERGDLDGAAGGDYRSVSLEENMKQAVFNRIITRRGTLLHRPDYGAGLLDFLNTPMTLQRKREMARAIKENVELDPRIQEVSTIAIQEATDGSGRVTLEINYIIQGYGSVTNLFEGVGA